METAEPSYQLNAQSSDRLGFGFFIAAAVHACVIFGFVEANLRVPTSVEDMEITLVTHYSDNEPEEADFWAQQSQEASGTKEDVLMPTSRSNNTLPGENDFEGEQASQASPAVQNSGAQVVSTVGQSDTAEQVDVAMEEAAVSSQSEAEARRKAILARLDTLDQEYAQIPRVGTLTSVSAKARDDAEYQLHIQDRIIEVGSANYPEASLENEIYGSLRLMLMILPDGSLESIEILEPSEHLMLDQAALEIARLCAPFNAFSGSTAAQYDKIAFIRTWQFLPGGQVQTRE